MEAGGKIYGEEIDGRRTNLVSGELGGLRKLKSFQNYDVLNQNWPPTLKMMRSCITAPYAVEQRCSADVRALARTATVPRSSKCLRGRKIQE